MTRHTMCLVDVEALKIVVVVVNPDRAPQVGFVAEYSAATRLGLSLLGFSGQECVDHLIVDGPRLFLIARHRAVVAVEAGDLHEDRSLELLHADPDVRPRRADDSQT